MIFFIDFIFLNMVWFSLRPYFYMSSWTWLKYFLLCSPAAHFLINILFKTLFELMNFFFDCKPILQVLNQTMSYPSCWTTGASYIIIKNFKNKNSSKGLKFWKGERSFFNLNQNFISLNDNFFNRES